MRAMEYCSLLLLLGILSGCTAMKGYPDMSGDLKTELKTLDRYYCADILDRYKNTDNESDRRELRDEIVNGRLRAIDIHYNSFEQSLAGEHVKMDFFSDVTLLALTGTSAVMPGYEVARTILSAVAAFVTGTKASIDEKVYFRKTIPVLFTKMESLRKKVLVRIRKGLTLRTKKYSLYTALIDLEDYYKAGTIPGALMGIMEESGAASQKADNELKSIITVHYKEDKNSELLLNYVQDKNDEIILDNENRLRKWMDDNDWKDIDTYTFIISAECEKARVQAVKALELTQ